MQVTMVVIFICLLISNIHQALPRRGIVPWLTTSGSESKSTKPTYMAKPTNESMTTTRSPYLIQLRADPPVTNIINSTKNETDCGCSTCSTVASTAAAPTTKSKFRAMRESTWCSIFRHFGLGPLGICGTS